MGETRRSIIPRFSYLFLTLLLAALLQSPSLAHPSTEDHIVKQLRQHHFLEKVCFPSVDGLSPTYGQNLEELFRSLVDSISSTGFNYTSVGKPPNTVYGFAECRGDIPADICRNCTEAAVERIKAECPSNSSALLWLEGCFLRFSNESFFNTRERTIRLLWTDPGFELSTEFGGEVSVGQLVKEAADSPKLYATRVEPKEGYTSYTLAQCAIYLNSTDCAECCQDAIEEIREKHALGRVWRFVSPSCVIVRYTWPFFLTSPTQSSASIESHLAGTGNVMRTVILICSTLLLALGIIVLHINRPKRKQHNDELSKHNSEIALLRNFPEDERNHELPQYNLRAVQEATDNFSAENMLGRGEFGLVYKGELNGRLVAVKRLSERSGHGLKEFMNEVTLIAKLQHKNLVRLLGCCVEKREKILINEFMPNGSLDSFFYDPKKRKSLEWEKRFNIIMGSARGILYLHQDSRLNIIHRELKASNILLDGQMTAKISDFGMARIFSGDNDPKATDINSGTHGHMAPEYAIDGKFSIKSDVYSFGVLLLEIISGQTYNGFYLPQEDHSLVQYAWKLWCKGRMSDLIDPVLGESASTSQILKCFHISLLCVQEDPASRPTMSTIITMLESDAPMLPTPRQPSSIFSGSSNYFSKSLTISVASL